VWEFYQLLIQHLKEKAMRSVKSLVRSALRVGMLVLGGAFVVTAMNSTALAITQPVPEIDPGTITSGLALFTGTVLLLTGRRWKS
jgi:hypothetical protein